MRSDNIRKSSKWNLELFVSKRGWLVFYGKTCPGVTVFPTEQVGSAPTVVTA
jgi:hypothetical protein